MYRFAPRGRTDVGHSSDKSLPWWYYLVWEPQIVYGIALAALSCLLFVIAQKRPDLFKASWILYLFSVLFGFTSLHHLLTLFASWPVVSGRLLMDFIGSKIALLTFFALFFITKTLKNIPTLEELLQVQKERDEEIQNRKRAEQNLIDELEKANRRADFWKEAVQQNRSMADITAQMQGVSDDLSHIARRD